MNCLLRIKKNKSKLYHKLKSSGKSNRKSENRLKKSRNQFVKKNAKNLRKTNKHFQIIMLID